MKKIFPALLSIALIPFSLANESQQSLNHLLYQQIIARQITAPSDFRYTNIDGGAKFSWYHKPGLFESWIHFNFVAKKDEASIASEMLSSDMRNNIRVLDNNYFVTAWTLTSLMSANAAGTIQLDPGVLTNAITAELSFLDKNNPNSSLTSFWGQEKLNLQSKKFPYVATPHNLVSLINTGIGAADFIKGVCTKLPQKSKAGCLVDANKLIDSLNVLKNAFHIPSDTDDTSLNLAMGADLLYLAHTTHNDMYLVSYQQWHKQNTVQSIALALHQIIHYMYVPAEIGRASCRERV